MNRSTVGGDFIEHVDVGSSISYGGAVNYWIDNQTQVGFQFGLQDSSLGVKGSVDREVTGMNIYSYHGTVTYHAGSSTPTYARSSCLVWVRPNMNRLT